MRKSHTFRLDYTDKILPLFGSLARVIFAIYSLGDDAFQLDFGGLFKQGDTIFYNMIAIFEDVVLGQDFSQKFFSFDQLELCNVFTIELETIKNNKLYRQVLGALVILYGLKGWEAIPEDHNLTVKNCIDSQLYKLVIDLWVSLVVRKTITGIKAGLRTVQFRDSAVAVPFYFKQPFRVIEWRFTLNVALIGVMNFDSFAPSSILTNFILLEKQ